MGLGNQQGSTSTLCNVGGSFALLLDDPQPVGSLCQVGGGSYIFIYHPVVQRLYVVVQPSVHHLHTNALHWHLQKGSYIVAQVQQHTVEHPCAPYLQLHSIAAPYPQVGQVEQSLGLLESGLDAPPIAVHLYHLLHTQHFRVQHVGQILVPHPVPL